MKPVKDFTTKERLEFIRAIRHDPQLAAAAGDLILNLAEFSERELARKKGKLKAPSLLSFKRVRTFKAFFTFQASRANSIIRKAFKSKDQ